VKTRDQVVLTGIAAWLAAGCGAEPAGPTGAGIHVVAQPASQVLADDTVAGPSIVLLDAANKGVSGASVTFRVIAGGGRVSDSTATTDGSGRASLGSWTMGPTHAVNSLEIVVAGESPETVSVNARWRRRLAASALGACAVSSRMHCWGDNSHREFSIFRTGSLTPVPGASQLSVALGFDEVFGSFGHHACGRSADGVGVCWGRNDFGQSGSYLYSLSGVSPVPMYGHEWRQFSPGRITTCGIDKFADAYCWGANQRGEIGNPATNVSFSARIEAPTQVIAGVKFKQISAGWQHACAIATNDSVYCWGANLDGQLGIGVVDSSHVTAVAVATSEKFAVVAAGGRHTCGITTDGRAFCWGQNAYGQLGDSSQTLRTTPTPVAGGLRFTTITVGTFFVSAIPPELSTPPVAATAAHTCALTAAGQAWCWGWNGWGQLGDGTLVDRAAPVPVSGSLTLSGLALGESSACGMRGAQVWCWGGNASGQLGDGTTTRRLAPVQIALP
jgi:alpha-tubulin suppressor-like RCC1 family protein